MSAGLLKKPCQVSNIVPQGLVMRLFPRQGLGKKQQVIARFRKPALSFPHLAVDFLLA